jgi:hypothetical protein
MLLKPDFRLIIFKMLLIGLLDLWMLFNRSGKVMELKDFIEEWELAWLKLFLLIA